MRQSRRAKRMERHHRRGRAGGALNLVALMDIFTILVFFLLVNASNVQPGGRAVRLPESVADETPRETLVITVSQRDVLVQGRRVATVDEVLGAETEVIAGLKEELDYQAKRRPLSGDDSAHRRQVTIMGDRRIPYHLLRRILVTCTESDYNLVSLAVIQRPEEKG